MKNVSLSADRDLPMLQFLWRWKFATTATLFARFFPENSPITAYKRLWTLKKRGFIRVRADSQGRRFVWTLDQKGFAAIEEALPSLRAKVFHSENVGHDLLVNAVHLGDWLTNAPEGAGLFSEQQMRCYHFEHYPAWVPGTDHHRADGYWKVPTATGSQIVALEVELTSKRNTDYESVARFYSHYPDIHRVLWIVPRKSLAKIIHELIQKELKGTPSIHVFATFGAFREKGWNAQIEVGVDCGKTIADVLSHKLEHPSKHVSTNVFLDTRKTPHRSKTSAIFTPSDFSDRLVPKPSRTSLPKRGNAL